MPEGEEKNEGRQLAWLIGAGLAMVVAVVITMIALWPAGDDASSAAALPGYTPRPAVPEYKPDPVPSSPVSSPSAGVTPSVSGSPSKAVPGSPSVPPTGTTLPAKSAPPASSAPPKTDRVGAITGADGCLDIDAGTIYLGNGLAVHTCNRTTSQRWTVAADGTLRSSGACARSESGGAVKLRSCAAGDAFQWKTGAGGTIVNAEAGTCLSRVGGGAVRQAKCGGDGQDWNLP